MMSHCYTHPYLYICEDFYTHNILQSSSVIYKNIINPASIDESINKLMNLSETNIIIG